jgi:hypothetical protein
LATLLLRAMLTISCHCGAIGLEFARRPRKLTQCNCSICRRYGAIWAYYRRKSVQVASRRIALAVYSGVTRGVSSIAARTVARLLTMRALGNEPTVPIGLPSTCVTSMIQNWSQGSRSRCLMAHQHGRCLVNTFSQIYFVHPY